VSVIDNQNITIAQIRSNEHLYFNNKITYKQAYCSKQALLRELEGDESKAFAKIPVLCQQIRQVDKDNYVSVSWSDNATGTGNFEAIFIAPLGTCNA
jgi:hypothetical protein